MRQPEINARYAGPIAYVCRGIAETGQTITYGALRDLLGIPVPFHVKAGANLLYAAKDYCDLRGWEDFTRVIIRADTGLPGAGFPARPIIVEAIR